MSWVSYARGLHKCFRLPIYLAKIVRAAGSSGPKPRALRASLNTFRAGRGGNLTSLTAKLEHCSAGYLGSTSIEPGVISRPVFRDSNTLECHSQGGEHSDRDCESAYEIGTNMETVLGDTQRLDVRIAILGIAVPKT